jgi:hypothetical protein
MDKSKRPILDEFGMALMTQVRDDAAAFLQRVISGRMADEGSKRQFKQFQTLRPADREVLGQFLVLALDAGIARFLHFLDANEIEVLFRYRSGEKHNVQAISDGLAGELYTEDGWIAKFSAFKDRIVPFSKAEPP